MVYEVRELLEGLSARRAETVITPSQPEYFRNLLGDVALEDTPANRRKYMRHDYMFHSGVLDIAGSTPLTQTLGSLNIMVSAFSGSGIIRPMNESMAEHAEILEAFGDRDPDDAEAAMRRHLSRTVELLYHEADLIERKRRRVRSNRGKLWGRQAKVNSPASGSGSPITIGWHTLVQSLGRAGGPAVRRLPAHQYHGRDRHGRLAALPVRLSVYRQRATRRGVRPILRCLRRRLGRRHGRPLKRQPARHAVVGEGRGGGTWRWRRPRTTRRRAQAGGDHCCRLSKTRRILQGKSIITVARRLARLQPPERRAGDCRPKASWRREAHWPEHSFRYAAVQSAPLAGCGNRARSRLFPQGPGRGPGARATARPARAYSYCMESGPVIRQYWLSQAGKCHAGTDVHGLATADRAGGRGRQLDPRRGAAVCRQRLGRDQADTAGARDRQPGAGALWRLPAAGAGAARADAGAAGRRAGGPHLGRTAGRRCSGAAGSGPGSRRSTTPCAGWACGKKKVPEGGRAGPAGRRRKRRRGAAGKASWTRRGSCSWTRPATATNMARRYGRCPASERLVAAVPHGHWHTTTFIAGLRQAGITAPLVLDGPMTGAAFRAYVEQCPGADAGPGRRRRPRQSRPRTRSKALPPAIAAAGASILYLPPYIARPQPDRAALRQAQGAAAQGRRPDQGSPLVHHRQADRHLLSQRVHQLSPQLRLWFYLKRKCSSRTTTIGSSERRLSRTGSLRDVRRPGCDRWSARSRWLMLLVVREAKNKRRQVGPAGLTRSARPSKRFFKHRRRPRSRNVLI